MVADTDDEKEGRNDCIGSDESGSIKTIKSSERKRTKKER